jgi:hypothetical protein
MEDSMSHLNKPSEDLYHPRHGEHKLVRKKPLDDRNGKNRKTVIREEPSEKEFASNALKAIADMVKKIREVHQPSSNEDDENTSRLHTIAEDNVPNSQQAPMPDYMDAILNMKKIDKLTSAEDVWILMNRRNKIDLNSSHFTDPIFRNLLRRSNQEYALEIIKNSSSPNDSLDSILEELGDTGADSLLCLLEYGLIWNKDDFLLRRLTEALDPESKTSIYQTLQDPVAIVKLNKQTSALLVGPDKIVAFMKHNNREDNMRILYHLLKIVVHCCLYFNDRAFEAIKDAEFVFKRLEVVSLIGKGLIQIMNENNISDYFLEPKCSKLVNYILKMMLSYESDPMMFSLSNLANLSTIPGSSKTIYKFMVTTEGVLTNLVVKLVNPQEHIANAKDKLSATDIPRSLLNEATQAINSLKRKFEEENYSEEMCIWFGVLDLIRPCIWLCLVLYSLNDKRSTHQDISFVFDFIASLVTKSSWIESQLFKDSNWCLLEPLFNIEPCYFLVMIDRLCKNSNSIFKRDSEILDKILILLQSRLKDSVKSLVSEEVSPGSSPMATAELTIAKLKELTNLILSVEAMRSILHSLGHRSVGKKTKPLNTSASQFNAKLRTQADAFVQKILSKEINAIILYFIQNEAKVSELLQYTKDYNLLFYCQSFEKYCEKIKAFLANLESQQSTKKKIDLQSEKIEFVSFDLRVSVLKLFNDSIRYSSNYFNRGKILNNILYEKGACRLSMFDYLRKSTSGSGILAELINLYCNTCMYYKETDFMDVNATRLQAKNVEDAERRTKYGQGDKHKYLTSQPYGSAVNPSATKLRKLNPKLRASVYFNTHLRHKQEEAHNPEPDLNELQIVSPSKQAPAFFQPKLEDKITDVPNDVIGIDFQQFSITRTAELIYLVNKLPDYQGSLRDESVAPLNKAFLLRGLLKCLYKYFSCVLYNFNQANYQDINLERLIEALKNMNKHIEDRLPMEKKPKMEVILDKYQMEEKNPVKTENRSINKKLVDWVREVRARQLNNFKCLKELCDFIEDIYEEFPEHCCEIAELRREDYISLRGRTKIRLYDGLERKENLNLNSLYQIMHGQTANLNLMEVKPPKKREANWQSNPQELIKRFCQQKEYSIGEHALFSEMLESGSESSSEVYFENLIRWITMKLEYKLKETDKSQPHENKKEAEKSEKRRPFDETYRGEKLVNDKECYALLHIMDNLLRYKDRVREICYEFCSSRGGFKDSERNRSFILISYLTSCVVQSQASVGRSIVASNILLDLEVFFVTSTFLKSLSQNNYTPFKVMIANHRIERDVNNTRQRVCALKQIYSGLVLNYTETDSHLIPEDKADLVWFNHVGLSLLSECMSGPCEENQNMFDKEVGKVYLKLFVICSRTLPYVDSPFYQLQVSVVKFLCSIFEGVNQNTIKRIKDAADCTPNQIYKMINKHLKNIWLLRAKFADTKLGLQSEDHIDEIYGYTQKFSMIQAQAEAKLKTRDLLDLYKTTPKFTNHPSIIMARTLYLIMSYADTAHLRKFSKFLAAKKEECSRLKDKNIMLKTFNGFKKKIGWEADDNDDPQKEQGGNELMKATTNYMLVSIVEINKLNKVAESTWSIVYFDFLLKITGSIEVVVKDPKEQEDRFVNVLFPILPQCLFISDDEVDGFINSCSIEDSNTRLFQLIDFVDHVSIEKSLSIKLFKIFPLLTGLTSKKTMRFFLLFIWCIGSILNIIWISTSDIVPQEPSKEAKLITSDAMIKESKTGYILIAITSAILIFNCFFALGAWFILSYKNNIEIDLLKDSKAKMIKKYDFTILSRLYNYVWRGFVRQSTPMILVGHILCVILYYTFTKFFITLHLILFFPHSNTTQYIIRSVTSHARKLLITLFLIVLVIYFFSTLFGYHHQDNFSDDFDNTEFCSTWASCLVYSINYGVRSGGGMGDFMKTLPTTHKYFWEKLFVSLGFLLLIKLIAQNIALGIIIDTFSELRSAQFRRSKH